ncbi:hypothetical protein D9611_003848 [Ephemerocybe angulata]|uniref:AMP-dependent synthetase/ligase domain-containing protein n=1 Tax=Ephemerocybe angulata TaxID=980116 RepID=A0A8H5B5U8_9AGAR|nr:hypothetical protein D9611_003848 [Tulosesus angulatus]
MDYFAQSRLLWTPPSRSANQTAVEKLRRDINRKHGLKLANYADLHKYSVENYMFWLDLAQHLRIIFSVPPDPSRLFEPGRFPEVPLWFPGAKFNYAENLLRRRDDSIAIIEANENQVITNYSYRQLYEKVEVLAAALRANGLQVGDRVAGIVSNTLNAVVTALAVASLGGMFSSTATDMGTQGILDRYMQIKPKFIVADTEVQYAGKVINLLPKIHEVVQALSGQGLKKAILFPSRVSGKELTLPDLALTTTLSAFLRTGDGRPLKFEPLPFCQPLFILYSSGTSGKPKCIVHTAGGVLIQTMKGLKLEKDLIPDDVYFQYTTTGWMMWTMMLSGIACEARTILYDGSPFYPNLPTYLRFINDQGVAILSTSPRFLSEIQGSGVDPLKIGSFESLKTMAVGGAVLTPAMFEWTHKAFGSNFYLASICGGTDVCASFVCGSPALPTYAGEMQCKALGMKVEIFDPAGNNIENTGQSGELVTTRYHPSFPVGFWGDDDGKKFREAYFDMYPGIWRQGDFLVKNPKTTGLMVLGRSDGVLNPSGVRFGSAEIYSVLEEFAKSIDDSICVGQRRKQDRDERVLLFLKMREGHKLTPSLLSKIRTAIRTRLSARHVPAFIFEVSEIPYTVNGKKIEIAVKQIVSGSTMQPSGTVANPDSLKLYYKFQEIERFANTIAARATKKAKL